MDYEWIASWMVPSGTGLIQCSNFPCPLGPLRNAGYKLSPYSCNDPWNSRENAKKNRTMTTSKLASKRKRLLRGLLYLWYGDLNSQLGSTSIEDWNRIVSWFWHWHNVFFQFLMRVNVSSQRRPTLLKPLISNQRVSTKIVKCFIDTGGSEASHDALGEPPLLLQKWWTVRCTKWQRTS